MRTAESRPPETVTTLLINYTPQYKIKFLKNCTTRKLPVLKSIRVSETVQD